MEITNLTNMTNFFEFVSSFYTLVKQQKIVLVYEGEINQEITKSFSAMTEQDADKEEDSSKTRKRLYHVMVECLQNVAKHAHDEVTGEAISPGKGLLIVSRNEDNYYVTTGNVILNDNAEYIDSLISKVNELSEDEIKELYKKMIRESKLSDKAGAGLGFIDIVKKTGNKIDYHFAKLNDKTSLFIQKSEITREHN